MIENPIRWPNGARCAVAFTFDMDGESLLHIYHGDTAPNRVALASMLRYGPEVAVPRIVESFARLGMKQTFFVPGWCVERYPRAVELIYRGGHEIGHHGFMHENPSRLSRAEEEESLARGIESIRSITGEKPQGYRAPSNGFSRHSLDLLLNAQFTYDASLFGRDIPYLLSDGAGRELVELASDLALDDWSHFVCIRDFNWLLPVAAPERAAEVYRAEFDAAWEYGGMWIGIWHPFLSGRMSRHTAMLSLIDYMTKKGHVWFARLDEIAAHARRSQKEDGWQPYVERLPFYTEPISGVPWGRPIQAG